MEINWCICKRRILTSKQLSEIKPCDLCQAEHAKSLADRFWKSETYTKEDEK